MISPLFLNPIITALGSTGQSIDGAEIYSYLSGTSTATPLYQDEALSVAAANPVVADVTGRFPALYADPDVVYKIELRDKPTSPPTPGTLLWTVDPYTNGFEDLTIRRLADLTELRAATVDGPVMLNDGSIWTEDGTVAISGDDNGITRVGNVGTPLRSRVYSGTLLADWVDIDENASTLSGYEDNRDALNDLILAAQVGEGVDLQGKVIPIAGVALPYPNGLREIANGTLTLMGSTSQTAISGAGSSINCTVSGTVNQGAEAIVQSNITGRTFGATDVGLWCYIRSSDSLVTAAIIGGGTDYKFGEWLQIAKVESGSVYFTGRTHFKYETSVRLEVFETLITQPRVDLTIIGVAGSGDTQQRGVSFVGCIDAQLNIVTRNCGNTGVYLKKHIRSVVSGRFENPGINPGSVELVGLDYGVVEGQGLDAKYTLMGRNLRHVLAQGQEDGYTFNTLADVSGGNCLDSVVDAHPGVWGMTCRILSSGRRDNGALNNNQCGLTWQGRGTLSADISAQNFDNGLVLIQLFDGGTDIIDMRVRGQSDSTPIKNIVSIENRKQAGHLDIQCLDMVVNTDARPEGSAILYDSAGAVSGTRLLNANVRYSGRAGDAAAVRFVCRANHSIDHLAVSGRITDVVNGAYGVEIALATGGVYEQLIANNLFVESATGATGYGLRISGGTGGSVEAIMVRTKDFASGNANIGFTEVAGVTHV